MPPTPPLQPAPISISLATPGFRPRWPAGVPAGAPGVNYPASSPNGIGVGGTSVLSPAGPTEIAWYAGGGGSSLLEPTPAFQSNTKVGPAGTLLHALGVVYNARQSLS